MFGSVRGCFYVDLSRSCLWMHVGVLVFQRVWSFRVSGCGAFLVSSSRIFPRERDCEAKCETWYWMTVAMWLRRQSAGLAARMICGVSRYLLSCSLCIWCHWVPPGAAFSHTTVLSMTASPFLWSERASTREPRLEVLEVFHGAPSTWACCNRFSRVFR